MGSIAVSDITGLVLAGGRAQRMGGIDKGLIPFKGLPLIEFALERLKPQVNTILINANRNHSIYSSYGYPVLADEDDSFSGPLAGFVAGLKACKTPYLMTVPCDSPLFPLDLAKQLAITLEAEQSKIGYASSKDMAGKVWAQPVFCLMRRDLLDSLTSFLASGERKIDRWFAHENAASTLFADDVVFANANTPEELAQLESFTHSH
jgi:molybdopterin-guanine dinucleotide biosynthesis protein A